MSDSTCPASPTPFRPEPKVVIQIRDRLTSGRGTLTDIAHEFGTDLWSLVEWGNQPEIRRVFEARERVLNARVRLACQRALPLVLKVLRELEGPRPGGG